MLLEKLIWIVTTRTVFYIDEGNLVCVDYCFSFFHYGGTFKLIDMHEPGFDDDTPDMVEDHKEFCPCDECCYPDAPIFTREEMDQMWKEFAIAVTDNPDDLDLPW